ncbi:MAG: S41 family peptidase [Planctomycetes bacterium]|nr:S41 family peptidase [Planctomycetota bacterium]
MPKKIITTLLYAVILVSLMSFTPMSIGEPPAATGTLPPPVKQPAANIGDLISGLAKQDITTDSFWKAVAEIEAVGKDGLAKLALGLENSDIKVRVGCARAMYQVGYREEAVKVLIAVLALPAQQIDKQVFSAAAEVLANLIASDGGGSDIDRGELAKKVQSILDGTLEASRRLWLAKLWYEVDRSSLAVKEVREISTLKDPDIRLSAALVLASMNDFERSKDVLKQLSLDPTPTGRLARLFLKYKEDQDSYSRKTSKSSKKSEIDYTLLDEVLGLIKERYVDPNQFDIKKLMTAAAKGIAGSLDRFSEYEDEEDKKRANEDISKKYGGIGAHVSMRDDYLTIERPIYGAPADKAGLRSLDRIIEVEGETTRGKDINKLVKSLKGDPGTPVKIKVYRRGWPKEREYTLTRAIVNVSTASYHILPGNIGYLQLTVNFATDTAKEASKCLQEMKYQSVKAIIIDIRGNPGGLLRTVNEMIDLFIEKDKVIVTTRDRKGIVAEYRTQNDDKIDVPMYILIDGGSASASEIFSGVMQDYHKAVIVGSTSYGKGSVQQPIDLSTTDGATALKMTIAKYYLPSGRSVEKNKEGKGGVEPDIKAIAPEQDFGKASEFNKLIESGELDKYTNEYYENNKLLFQTLAEDDGENYANYPDFEKFYSRCKERLEKDEVRQALRGHIRRKVADDRQKEFIVDVQTDMVLQRAIIEACRSAQVNINPDTIPAYKKFSHKFDSDKDKESLVK